MNVWHWVWFIGVYLAALCCFVAIIRIGVTFGWKVGLRQVLVFVGFAVAYWFLESWATWRAPFYYYPPEFPDMIRLFRAFPSFLASGAGSHPCAAIINAMSAQMPPKVPASVPLGAAIITFTLMWTGRLLIGMPGWVVAYKPIVLAFSVGTAALIMDLYMDPVLATSRDCLGNVVHPGLGFWVWYTDPDFADGWFRIPLFNFASWFAAPATLVSFVILIAGALTATTTSTDMLLRGLILFLVGAILFSAPNANPPMVQMALVALLVVLGLYHVFMNWSTYVRNNAFRWGFILPLLFFFLFPLAALLFAGASPLYPLLIVAGVLAAIGVIYTFTPYVKWP